MPNTATQLYHKNPDLQILLDFLGRCESDGQRLTAHYQHGHELDPVKAACAQSHIHPLEIRPAPDTGQGKAPFCLALDHADWLVLSGKAVPLLAQELRLRLPAISAALKFAPLHWDALALPDAALSAWGAAAGMVALPRQVVFDYLGSRYPGDAEQRGRYAVISDARHAAGYKKNNALGFLVTTSDAPYFACHADDWSREVSSAASLVNFHLALMLKIGLQMLEAGVTAQLKELSAVLSLAGDARPLVKLQTLLETYQDHIAAYGAGQHGFRDTLLKNCVRSFEAWQTDCKLVIAYQPGAPQYHSPIRDTREIIWAESGAFATATADLSDLPKLVPAAPLLASPTGVAPDPEAGPGSRAGGGSTTAQADPVVADGVIIPEGVTVARGAHVRVCDISVDTRLKPGTVFHGDVSIASHTRFDGPLTIMNDVRIGRGLKLGSRLILSEGATISTYAVRSVLPPGTGIAGNLRIGEGAHVGRNVSFGAENWIGERVRIGQNVRFGSWVQVNSDISIGANARIEGPARLIGDVPENAEITGNAVTKTISGSTQDSAVCAISIPVFTIAKNETIRNRQATPRKPLASTQHAGSQAEEEAPRLAAQGLRTPEAPPGAQRKRAPDAIVARDAKRIRTGLEARYRDAESGPVPAGATEVANTGRQAITADLPSSGKPASTPAKITATARPELQKPVQRPPGAGSRPTAPVVPPVRYRAEGAMNERQQTAAGNSASLRQPAPATPKAPEPPVERNAQRKAWQKTVISSENQRALERAMRTSIRIPSASAGSKTADPFPAAEPPVLQPLYNSKGPML